MKKNKLKILFSHYGVKYGEGWGRSFSLASELASRGHRVTLLTSQYGEFVFPYHKEYIDNVEVISFPDIVPRSFRKGGFGVLNILLRCLYVINKKYDIVHSDSGHRPSSGIPCVFHRFLHKSKYVSEWWDYFGKGGIYDEMPWWYRLTLGNYDTWAEVHNKKIADGVICLSEFTKERSIKAGINAEKILVLHGGADIRRIKYYPNNLFKKKFGIPEDTLTFAFVGMNDSEIKDIEPFLDALKDFDQKKKLPGLLLEEDYQKK